MDSPKGLAAVQPEDVKAVEVPEVKPTVQEDPIVVEASTSAPQEEQPTLSTLPQPTEHPIKDDPSADPEPIELETTASEKAVEEQLEPAQTVPASPAAHTEAIPSQPETIKPLSYAAAAAVEPTPSPNDQPSQPTEGSSKLGLDLHGASPTQPKPVGDELPAEDQQPPSFAQVAASAEESEQPSGEATPEASAPVTPAPEGETEDVTPASEPAEEGIAVKAGKPKGKGKGGKGKKKKGKK